MAQRNYFSREYILEGATGSTVTHDDEVAPSNTELHIERVTVENQSSSGCSARIGIERAGTFRVDGFIKPMPVDTPSTYDSSEIVINPSERLRIDLIDTVDADVIKLKISGYAWIT